jgi:predicted PurR-regulated permease PerM
MKLSTQYFFWLVAPLILLVLISVFRDVLLPFVLGGAIAYLLNPIVEYLTRKGMGRPSAAIFILGLFFLMVGGILMLLTPVLFHEAAGFIKSFPLYLEKLKAFIEVRIAWIEERMGDDITAQIQTVLQDNAGKALQVGKGVLGGITSGGGAVMDFFTTLFITPIAAYFFIKEWPRVTDWVENLIPREHLATVHDLLGQIDRKIAGFVRGQISVCSALGAFYAVALSIAGLQYGFVIGVATGVLSVIPFVGSTIGLLTSVTVAYFGSDGNLIFTGVVAAIFFFGQFVEGNFLTPKLMGDSVGLHPLWIIFALMAGGSLMGILGMFLAVPVTASIGVLAAFAISEYKKSQYFLGKQKKIDDTARSNPA